MSKQPFLNTYGRQILIWSVITAVIAIALNMGIDQKVVVFGTVVIGVFTQAFAGLAALIATIPLIGPFIIKVLAIPFFWILNALGYFVGAVAIKKGYRSEFTKSRILTLALLIGIIIGYIIGHLVPMR
jgi:fatty-acid desaturase